VIDNFFATYCTADTSLARELVCWSPELTVFVLIFFILNCWSIIRAAR
jgi:hypothetical protein